MCRPWGRFICWGRTLDPISVTPMLSDSQTYEVCMKNLRPTRSHYGALIIETRNMPEHWSVRYWRWCLPLLESNLSDPVRTPRLEDKELQGDAGCAGVRAGSWGGRQFICSGGVGTSLRLLLALALYLMCMFINWTYRMHFVMMISRVMPTWRLPQIQFACRTLP